MVTINENYLKLKAGYLFPEIARRVNTFAEANPNAPIIKLGIGDVTEPLPEACRTAMTKAVEEMGDRGNSKVVKVKVIDNFSRKNMVPNNFTLFKVFTKSKFRKSKT